MKKVRFKNFKAYWKRLRAKEEFHNALLFLIFVVIATLFWIVLAMNDSVTRTVEVKLVMQNVPDSIKFIQDPPEAIHVTVSDRGSNILRTGWLTRKDIHINFRDFAHDGVFRFTKADMSAAIKSIFGPEVQIGAISNDSLLLQYTSGQGKRVPVILRLEAGATAGNILAGEPTVTPHSVMVFSGVDELDTIQHVYTDQIYRRNLSETAEITARIQPISGARIEPKTVKVRIPVEPLVKKEAAVTVEIDNVPKHTSLLLFPTKVLVDYYTPMSRFDDDDPQIVVAVNYSDTERSASNKLPLRIVRYPDYVVNPELRQQAVEYTLIRE